MKLTVFSAEYWPLDSVRLLCWEMFLCFNLADRWSVPVHLHSERTGLESPPGYRFILTEIFVLFPGFTRKFPGCYLKICHDLLVTHSS